MYINITLKSHFCRKKRNSLSYCTQRYHGRHNISWKSGLSILLHDVILLLDAKSSTAVFYDAIYVIFFLRRSLRNNFSTAVFYDAVYVIIFLRLSSTMQFT